MTNPVLVEVSRGPLVESRHRGAACVMDADGGTVVSIGDVEAPVFPRSAVKAIQGIPLIESGAADTLSFGEKELSLACSSHSGEDAHVQLARNMLSRAGMDESCLECGGHWSSQAWVMRHQSRIYDSTPPAICNNCSGKHAGFVSIASHLGIDTEGYINSDHPIQRIVNDVLQDVTGASHDEDICGRDGCSIPTYAIPLSAMARGFAKMATGHGLGRDRARAATRLLSACMKEPFYMAGTGRFCTELMEAGSGRVFAKTGAEGVFCGAIPELGFGIALKCDDGASRASEVMMAAVVAHLLPDSDPLQQELLVFSSPQVKSWNGWSVGEIRAQLPI